MELMHGKIAAQSIKNEIKSSVDNILQKNKRAPHLAAILVGENGASSTYVSNKIKACKEVGFNSTIVHLEESISEDKLIAEINRLNKNPEIDGILVQLPLPKQINEQVIVNCIHPSKDVDGFHPYNTGKLLTGNPDFIPATPFGIILLLSFYQIPTAGKKVVVIGRSNIVGRPISILLSQSGNNGDATVTVCHSRTKNIEQISKEADIIIAAVGIPGFVKKDMIKKDAVVIDVGITRVPDNSKTKGYRIMGDVDFDEVAAFCEYITPVPGGVGLMTIAALLKNTLHAYYLNEGI
jgi:methylenetetrahydrofolate dehydrogenase (NADP+)/methenyltetrahydrofolate cyclohydrolase